MWRRGRSCSLRSLLWVVAFCASLFGQAPEISLGVATPFYFVAYGDVRVTDAGNRWASNAPVRRELVKAIADTHPAFVSVGGDLVYKGDSTRDWDMWAKEAAAWREQNIPVFPAIGNHELRGNQSQALTNYFAHFPDLKESRYYSVRAGNVLMLVLDSSLKELSGPQGEWLKDKLDKLPGEVRFVVLVLHHPPYTDSSPGITGSGHGTRRQEKELAQWLEARQKNQRARFLVLAGHVHNYEHHEHGGITYLVTGGGGAYPYAVKREQGDPLTDKKVNYHYLLIKVEPSRMVITMNRLDMKSGTTTWTQPDTVEIKASAAAGTAAGKQ